MCVFDITTFFGRDKGLRQLCRMPATSFYYSLALSINVALWGKSILLEDFVFGQCIGPNCITALGVKVAAAGSFGWITQYFCSLWLNHTASSEGLVAFISYFLVNATTTWACWATPSTRNKKSGVKDLVVWIVSLRVVLESSVIAVVASQEFPIPPPMFLIARPQKKWSCTGALFASLPCCGRLRNSSAGRSVECPPPTQFLKNKRRKQLLFLILLRILPNFSNNRAWVTLSWATVSSCT